MPAATVAASPDAATVDPWEGLNRGLFGLNKGIDRAVLRPTAVFYAHAVPSPARAGVHNVLYNLGEPVSVLNYVLQIRPSRAGGAALRFALNSTVGVLGVFDVADGAGLHARPTGFAQTLGRYGAGEGPYIFLPIAGPSSVRDLTGRVVDVVTDPFNFLDYRNRGTLLTARAVGGGLDSRVAADPVLRDVDRTATDPYATLRSAFLQNSNSKVHEGAVDAQALPDFGPEPGPAPAKPATPPRPH